MINNINIYLTLFIGIILSFTLYTIVSTSEQTRTQNFFSLHSNTRAYALENSLERNLDVVNLMAALFSSSSHVSRVEFKDFADKALKRNSAMKSLSWNPLVYDKDRERYVKNVRSFGHDNYEIMQESPSGKNVVSTNKKNYLPVNYIEPLEGNKKAIGLDLASNLKANRVINKARDSGKLTISQGIDFIQNNVSLKSCYIMQAIYKDGNIPLTQEMRRENFKGVVVGMFLFKDLVHSAMKNLSPVGIDIKIVDISNSLEKHLLFLHVSRTRKVLNTTGVRNEKYFKDKGLYEQSSIDVLGNKWSFVFTPAAKFFNNTSTWNAYVFFIAGLIITLLIMMYIRTKEKNAARLETKVKERTYELEIASRAKSDFLANMSHEIRTPLNGIIGFIDLLYNKETNLEKRNKLQVVKNSGYSLLNIINDILDFSKIESNKLVIENEPLALSSLFKQTADLFFGLAKEKNVSIDLNIDKALPKMVLGDSTRIKQVFTNLLSNAIKFTREGSEVSIKISYLREAQAFLCEVNDEGIGIEEKHLDTIFQSFEQADSSTTRKYGGTGLGLSISKTLVELMGGKIGVKSKHDIGSEFYFMLPIVEVTSEVETEENVEYDELQLQGKILIVEDNKTNQMLLKILLDELGLESFVVNDGSEAVDEITKNNYDLILMDENMPVLNGTEATRIIRSLEVGKTIPVIAVTANALKGDEEKFLECGMNAYLSKPIDNEKLKAVLKQYLVYKGL